MHTEADLSLADRHVAEAEAIVLKQREIIAELRGHGHDTGMAEQLLVEFETTLRDHLAHRDRIRDELGEA